MAHNLFLFGSIECARRTSAVVAGDKLEDEIHGIGKLTVTIGPAAK
jgi:hypothetical protein